MKLTTRIVIPAAVAALAGFVAVAWLGTRAAGPMDIAVAMAGVLGGGLAALGLASLLARDVAGRLRGLGTELRTILRGEDGGRPNPAGPPDEIGRLRDRLHALAATVRSDLDQREEVERQARTDALTNLPNRRGLTEFLERTLSRAGGDDVGRIGVMHIDLDHFKAVNDTLGHEAGDFVLREATRRMGAVLRDSDLLARLGGDEFIVVVPGIETIETLERLAQRMVERFHEPIHYAELACSVGASVGAVLSPSAATRQAAPQVLLHQADIALCEAKAGGRNRWALFTDQMAARISDAESKARAIREALLDDAFRPWLQPMVDVPTGRITGLELLSRWEHPEKGVVRPQEFLRAAETHGMLQEIGQAVLEKACREIQAWRADGLEVPKLYVNMTRAQLLAAGAVDKLTWTLDDHHVTPECVALEVSERALIDRSADLLFANIRRLAALGMELVLDDFGAESGAMQNIVAITAGRLKCSRALISGLRDEKRAAGAEAMLVGALGMAEKLGVTPVAKGVEDDNEVAALTRLGFSEMQGDALAPAMPAPALASWLSQRPDVVITRLRG